MGRYDEYVPNERVVDRAVEVWKRLLRSPKYDNLGDSCCSVTERLTSGFAASLARMIGSPATEEQLRVFGEALKKWLMMPIQDDWAKNILRVCGMSSGYA